MLHDNQDAQLAAMIADRIVGQVLDDAYVIANAALESGEPWIYKSMLKKLTTNSNGNETELNNTTESFENDVDSAGDDKDHGMDSIATSTPQKIPDNFSKTKPDKGQGDDDYELQTSTLINRLFDISEVKRVLNCENNVMDEELLDANLISQTMSKIIESFVNSALENAFEEYDTGVLEENDSNNAKECVSEYSTYSFLSDANEVAVNDICFFINDDIPKKCVNVSLQSEKENEYKEQVDPLVDEIKPMKVDLANFENAYMTLNRDCEHCSDDEGYPVLQDPETMILQEIDLMIKSEEDENNSNGELRKESEETLQEIDLLTVLDEYEEKLQKNLVAASAVSQRSRTSTLGRRFRIRGQKILACLRGWWRRKTPGLRKESRKSSVRGICRLSPTMRLRNLKQEEFISEMYRLDI